MMFLCIVEVKTSRPPARYGFELYVILGSPIENSVQWTPAVRDTPATEYERLWLFRV